MISEDHVTLKTGVMTLKISFDHRNKLHFTIYIKYENCYFFIVIITHNITVFLSNKCTLGEHNGLISEHYKFELFQIFDQYCT